jgi:hypothetical protein
VVAVIEVLAELAHAEMGLYKDQIQMAKMRIVTELILEEKVVNQS